MNNYTNSQLDLISAIDLLHSMIIKMQGDIKKVDSSKYQTYIEIRELEISNLKRIYESVCFLKEANYLSTLYEIITVYRSKGLDGLYIHLPFVLIPNKANFGLLDLTQNV